MAVRAGDPVRAHALFGSTEEIVEQRRAVYQVPIELLDSGSDLIVDIDVLDHPIVRGHLADVLSGSDDYDRDAMCRLADVAAARTNLAGCLVRVADSSDASDVLAPALRRVAAGLGTHGLGRVRLEVLTPGDSSFSAAHDCLLAGVELALDLVPELAGDLLPHVAVFAMLRQHSAQWLGSASAREYPGLVMLPEPTSALEAAEAFVHEGAHQKFFDLAISRSIFGANQYAAPAFVPTWAPPSRAAWPIEQALAAFHAYCCLAALMDTVRDRPGLTPPQGSLLPMADSRAREIGAWLLEQVTFLGPDGCRLVSGLLDRPPVGVAVLPVGSAARVEWGSDVAHVRHFSDRALIARRGRRIELFWQLGGAAPEWM